MNLADDTGDAWDTGNTSDIGDTGNTGSAGGNTISGRPALWPAIHAVISYESLLPLLLKPSTVNPHILFEALRQQKQGDVPADLIRAASLAARRYQRTCEVSEIDNVLDKELARVMNEAARNLGVPFLIDFLNLKTDLVNMGLLLRTRFLQNGAEYLKQVLLPGGNLPPSELAGCYDQPAESIASLAVQYKLAPLAKAIREYANGGDAIGRFSLAAEDMQVAFARKARFVLRGPEVVLGFLIAREMEIKTVRIILTCIRNRIPVERARALARLTYI